MIIDSHVHLFVEGWMHERTQLGTARIIAARMGKQTGEYPDVKELNANVAPLLYDPAGEKLIASMDAAGVDMACIFGVDFGLLTGETEVPIEEQNRMIAEITKHFPDRLVSFFSIDPRRPESLDLFSKAVEDWDMRGLKFHPTTGFFPHEEVCYPLYEKCMDYGLPVIIHTGGAMAPTKGSFTSPIYIDDVAADFPELPIIMAHAGQAEWFQALMVANYKPNIYMDISALEGVLVGHPDDFYRRLRRMIDDMGPWRIFFGSDSPLFNLLCPLDAWVKAIAEPDLSSCPDVSFTEDEKEIILGKAFTRLLGIQAT